jgi:hypothetical protein
MTKMLVEKRKDKDIEWSKGRDLSLWNALLKPLDVAFKIRSFHSLVMSYAVSWFQGKLLSTFGGSGPGMGQFNDISQLWTIGKEMYVADSLNRCVQIFDSTGQFQRQYWTRNLEPTGICGTNNSRYFLLRHFDRSTTAVYFMQDCLFGSVTQINLPITHASGIICDATSLYISDWVQHCVHVIALPGHDRIRKFGSYGVGDGQLSHPAGLCIHGDEYLCVSESLNYRISVFNCHTGAFVKHIPLENDCVPPLQLISIGDQLLVNILGTNIIRIIEFVDGSCRRQLTLPPGQTNSQLYSCFRGITLVDNVVFIADSANRIHRYE